MKTFIPLTAVALVALGLGACRPPHDGYGHWGKQARLMTVPARLDCPESRDGFTRTAVAADGRSCSYSGEHDSTLELKIVNVAAGDTNAALAPIEAAAASLVPINTGKPAASDAEGAAAPAMSSKPTNIAMHPAGAKLPNGRSEESVSDGDGDDVNVDMPFVHVHTSGDRAKVRVAGINVDADDTTDRAHITANGVPGYGNVSVEAHDEDAVIRIDNSDTNLRRRVQFSSGTAGPQGDFTAGYVAHGPRSGPLVVAMVRVKSNERSHHHHHGHDFDDIFDGAISLVAHNSGR